MCSVVYQTAVFSQVILMIPLEKKMNAEELAFRTTSLVTHALKMLLRILTERLENKAVKLHI